MNIAEKVKEILFDLSGSEIISPENNLQRELGLDSLALVTLLVEIEDEFEIKLNECDMNPLSFKTVDDIIGLVEKYCGYENL